MCVRREVWGLATTLGVVSAALILLGLAGCLAKGRAPDKNAPAAPTTHSASNATMPPG